MLLVQSKRRVMAGAAGREAALAVSLSAAQRRRAPKLLAAEPLSRSSLSANVT